LETIPWEVVMKRIILAIGGITALGVILWWVITWAVNGGWPSSGAVGGTLPPHIKYVTPGDGAFVEESHGFCAHFYYQAGRGMGSDPQKSVRYFIDGLNVTKKVHDLVRLEYGYPDPVGEPCFRQTDPLSSRWHTVKVTYTDTAGEEFEYMWRFYVINEQ
jgi:hypothetical protein